MRVLAALIVMAATVTSARQEAPFDLLITNARLLDGSGNPWLGEDLAIRGDRIVARGRLSGLKATRVIDARGLVVAPGFIDRCPRRTDSLYSDVEFEERLCRITS